jgi:hypothetical protein
MSKQLETSRVALSAIELVSWCKFNKMFLSTWADVFGVILKIFSLSS